MKNWKWYFSYRWFSICSAHFEYKEECPSCNSGSWVFMPFYHIEQLIYKVSPGLWRWWVNKGDVNKRFKNQFTDRKGNKKDVFPNL